MPQLARIHDRASFHAVLSQARAETGTAISRPDELEAVTQQLAFIERCLQGSDTRQDAAQRRVELGPMSLSLDSPSMAYRALLQEIDYAFHRYDALPDVFVGVDDRDRRAGILQVCYGRHAFDKVAVEPGARVVVGSDERSDLVLGKVTGLVGRHLEVHWDEIVGHVRALTDEPIVLAGKACRRGELRNGDVMMAGEATLRFFVEAYSYEPPAAPRGSDEARARLSGPWREGRLFAVLDAAAHPDVRGLLEESIEPHASLYEGERARGLDGQAPYLVKLSPRSGLFERLLAVGWGRAWGIFVESDAPTTMVRRSLRRLLMVSADTRPDPLYFRFYDPRVMCRFAPMATVRQTSEMLREATAIHYEGEAGALFTLARGDAS